MSNRLGLFSLLAFVICVIFCLACSPLTQRQDKNSVDPMKMIIDADTANEIDDLYALARAIVAPSIDLIGITSAQFHNSPLATDSTVLESHVLNQDIVRIMGRTDIPVVIGANAPLTAIDVPAISPAAKFIIDESLKMPDGDSLEVVILGSCTNVASAILMDPSIVSRIRVHYIGFWHDREKGIFNRIEFNSGNDQMGVDVLLNTEGLDFNIMTATTCKNLIFDKTETFSKLEGQNEIGDYLVNRWKTYDPWFNKKDPTKQNWIMWDIAIIEALIHPDMAEKSSFPNLPDNTPRQIQAYTALDSTAMKLDFFEALGAN